MSTSPKPPTAAAGKPVRASRVLPPQAGGKPSGSVEAKAHDHEADRRRRELQGTVVSDKMDKTIVVQVSRRYRHPKYKKYVNERKRYKAHDEKNEAKAGDKVVIVESRPISRDKRWRLQRVLERATIV
jgi:small subunit ribosomal protein S17